jgi:hypothetical protein
MAVSYALLFSIRSKLKRQRHEAVKARCHIRHFRTFGLWPIPIAKLNIINGLFNPLDGEKRLQNVAHDDYSSRNRIGSFDAGTHLQRCRPLSWKARISGIKHRRISGPWFCAKTGVAIMQKDLTSGIEVQVRQRPAGSDGSLQPSAQVTKSLNHYSLLLAPGVLAGLLAYVIYPPLDAGPLVAFGMCLLLLPFVLQLSSIVRNRGSEDVDRLRTAFVCASLALLLLSLMVLLNGWRDRSPQSAVRATVIQKTSTRHRSTTSYRVTVTSWRSGRSVEELTVGARTYNNAVIGKPVTVGVHKGAFGLPWYGDVSSK